MAEHRTCEDGAKRSAVNKRRARECSIQRDAGLMTEGASEMKCALRVRVLQKDKRRARECSIQRDAGLMTKGASEMKCALRVRVLQKGESFYDVQRGTPRYAPVAGEDGECNANESSVARPSKSSRSIRSDDHGDGVKSRSGRAGPAKRLSLQPPARSSSAHSTTQGASPRTSTRRQQRQGAVVVSPCCSLSGGAPEPPQAFRAPGLKGRGHDCKEERRKKCDAR
jgi:hypothetical protein